MTPNGVAQPIDFRGRLTLDTLTEYLNGLSKVFRPSDGWLATGLLTLNLMVVLWSVERANWVPTPSLIWVLLLGVVTGGILARIPFWGALVFPIGLAVGMLVVVWQLTSHQPLDVASADQLWARLALWLEAARTGAINIDTVPFAFGIVVGTWMVG